MQEYLFIGFKVAEYQCLFTTNINHAARERTPEPDTKVYQSQTFLEIRGNCCESSEEYLISIHSRDRGELDSTVGEYKVFTKQGEPRFRTIKGLKQPIYDVPGSIGYMDRGRIGAVWVDPEAVIKSV